MKSFLLVVLAIGKLFATAGGGPWTIENVPLKLTLRSSGSMAITHKVSQTTWVSEEPQDSVLSVSDVLISRDAHSLKASLKAGHAVWALVIVLAGEEPEIDVTLSAPLGTPLTANLEYPFAFKAPGPEYRIVLPHKTGLLFTAEDAVSHDKVTGLYDCYANRGLSMPWFGLTDLERGLQVMFETPSDAGVNVRLSGSVFSPQVYWLPTRGRVGYARKLHCRFFDRGGYVPMCKHYRSRLIAKGEFVTLREKEQEHPQLAKLIGALDLYMRGNDGFNSAPSDLEQIEVVKTLEAMGVRRMLINSNASKETLAWMSARGHLTGTYRMYTGIRPGAPGYPEDGYAQKDGTPLRGWAYSEQNKSTYRCSVRQIALMEEQVPPLILEKKYEALFLDQVTSFSLHECYQPTHPLDRRQDRDWANLLLRIHLMLTQIHTGLFPPCDPGAWICSPQWCGYFWTCKYSIKRR